MRDASIHYSEVSPRQKLNQARTSNRDLTYTLFQKMSKKMDNKRLPTLLVIKDIKIKTTIRLFFFKDLLIYIYI